MPRMMTDTELELMQVLWENGTCTVREVQEHLGPDRAYTTVATLMRILEEKGFAASEKDGRALRYAPLVAREQYARRGVRSLVERLFGGNRASLVRALVDDVSAEELAELEAVLAEARET